MRILGPKLILFFIAVVIYFAVYGDCPQSQCVVYCAFKVLPIIALMIFVVLQDTRRATLCSPYSRKILVGLLFSCLGDAFLVWKEAGYLLHGLLMFALAQALYACAFGFRPLRLRRGVVSLALGASGYLLLYPGLKGKMVFFVLLYVLLISLMNWRAVARWNRGSDERWTSTQCSHGVVVVVGSFCFVVSDFVVGIELFLAPVSYSHTIVMATYYAAQFGITMSVIEESRAHDARLKEKAANDALDKFQ